jgi:hypothetical protein
MSAGQESVGGGVGVTDILKLHETLAVAFVAVQVTVVVPSGYVAPDGGCEHVTVTPIPVTIGGTYCTVVGVGEITMISGEQVIDGGALTVTLKLHDALPTTLVAVQVTLVVPGGKIDPDGGSQTTVAALVAVGAG